MKKLFTILFLLLGAKVFSQSSGGFNMIGPSPTAAGLAQYAQSPVNLNTGTPQISIPITVLAGRTLSLPVSISYHALGRRVDERASSVGLGWSLNAGGAVTRFTNGFYDDCPRLYNWTDENDIPQQFIWGAPNTPIGGYLYNNENMGENFENGIYDININAGFLDAQPDNFLFNFLGHTGGFVFSADDEPVIIPWQNVIVEWNYDTDKSFRFTDDQGYVYFFEKFEYTQIIKDPDCDNEDLSTFYPFTEAKFISTWYITKVENSSGQVEFEFEYNESLVETEIAYDQEFKAFHSVAQWVENVNASSLTYNETPVRTCTSVVKYKQVSLKKITSPNGYVEFEQEADFREDLIQEHALQAVKTYNTEGLLISKTGFEYTYSISGSDKRLQLHKVVNYFDDGTTSWQEMIYEGSLPEYNSKSKDHWGFHNGAIQDNLLPAYKSAGHNFAGADRSASEACKDGNLVEIKSSNQSSTRYVYELNNWTVQPNNSNFIGYNNDQYVGKKICMPKPVFMYESDGSDEDEIFSSCQESGPSQFQLTNQMPTREHPNQLTDLDDYFFPYTFNQELQHNVPNGYPNWHYPICMQIDENLVYNDDDQNHLYRQEFTTDEPVNCNLHFLFMNMNLTETPCAYDYLRIQVYPAGNAAVEACIVNISLNELINRHLVNDLFWSSSNDNYDYSEDVGGQIYEGDFEFALPRAGTFVYTIDWYVPDHSNMPSFEQFISSFTIGYGTGSGVTVGVNIESLVNGNACDNTNIQIYCNDANTPGDFEQANTALPDMDPIILSTITFKDHYQTPCPMGNSGGGLRVKEIIQDPDVNVPDDELHRYFQYEQGCLMSIPHYKSEHVTAIQDNNLECINEHGNNPDIKGRADVYTSTIHSNSSVDLARLNGGFVSYRKVIERLGQNNGLTEYTYGVQVPQEIEGEPHVPNNYKAWNNGLMTQKIVKNQNGDLVAVEMFEYEDNTAVENVVYGYAAQASITGWNNDYGLAADSPSLNGDDGQGGQGFFDNAWDAIIDFFDFQTCQLVNSTPWSIKAHKTYAIPTGQRRIKKHTNRLYSMESPTSCIENVSVYYYDNPNLSSATRVLTYNTPTYNNGIGDQVVTLTRFSSDYPYSANPADAQTLAINKLLDKNILSAPIEQITLIGNDANALKVENAACYIYQYHPDLDAVLQQSIYLLEHHGELSLADVESHIADNGGASATFWKHPGYKKTSEVIAVDTQQRVLAQKLENEMVHSVIRDYVDGRVVAEVLNAHPHQCAYSSFETSNHGGWTYNESLVTHNSTFSTPNALGIKLAKTGRFALEIDAQNGAAREIEAGNYRLTFWCTGVPQVFLGSLAVNANTTSSLAIGIWRFYEYSIDCPSQKNLSVVLSGTQNPIGNYFLDELRFTPKDAIMSTNTFDELGRQNSVCDANNYCSYYVYNAKNQLAYTMDEDLNILSYTEYYLKSSADENDRTHIKSYTALAPGVTPTHFQYANDHLNEVSRSVAYFDGFNRSTQEIAVDAIAPGNGDLVSFHLYDNLGRESTSYLPYVDFFNEDQFATDLLNKQANFYQTQNMIAHTEYPSATTTFENSPMGRPLEKESVGEHWQDGSLASGQGHTTKSKILLNAAGEVLKWTDFTGYSFAMANGQPVYWPPNTLIKTETIGESGQKSWTYTDPKGRTVMTRTQAALYEDANGKPYTADFSNGEYQLGALEDHEQGITTDMDTYFVYDIHGQLSLEIPPVVTWQFSHGDNPINPTFDPHTSAENYEIFDEFIFAYLYDYRGRQIAKKAPGMGWSYYVYNNLNQIIMSQDPEQSLTNRWSFVKYDGLGRAVMTGITRTEIGRAQLQSDLDGITTNLWEYRSTDTGNMHGYTDTSFPTDIDEIWTINYFDDYNFQTNGVTYTGAVELGNRTLGLSTGSKVKVLESDPEIFLTSIVYYDQDGRAVESWSETPRGARLKSAIEYDWQGQVLQTYSAIAVGAENDPIVTQTSYVYDRNGKLLKTYFKAGQHDDPVLLTENKYNVLGQVVKKKLHQPLGYDGFMQIVDYRYNEKGWLTKINNAELAADGDNLDDNDVFGEELIYTRSQILDDNVDEISGSELELISRYDGKIAMMEWKTKVPDAPQNEDGYHAYIMRYDDLGQQTNAIYAKADAFGVLTLDHNFWMEKTSYSIAGNILSMQRNRPSETPTPVAADMLTYSYNNASRVTTITDGGLAEESELYTHFIDVDNGTNPDYTYDIMGRMVHDYNKGFTYQYNQLGQVKSVDDGWENPDALFTYDATGTKWMKNVGGNITHYIGGAEFKDDGSLISIATPEGAIRPNTTEGEGQPEYVYDYYLTDHLGNVRVILSDENATDVVDIATLEPYNVQDELIEFENLTTTIDNTPPDWALISSLNTKVAHLSANGSATGPSYLAKVAISDKLSVTVESFYRNEEDQNNSTQTLTQIFAGMLVNIGIQGQGVIPACETGLGNFANVTSAPSTSLMNFLNSHENELDGALPQSYLVYVLFNERLIVDPAYSGVVQVGDPDLVNIMGMVEKTLPRDGYFFTYVTNQSTRSVYFNNLAVTRKEGIIRNVNDYYPYGLTWNKLPDTELRNAGYQGKDWQSGEWPGNSIALYDFHARMYDPTLGRWLVPDPAEQHYSLYLAMGNNPMSMVDPDGMWAGGTDPNDYYFDESNNLQAVYINNKPDQLFRIRTTLYQPGSFGIDYLGGYNDQGGWWSTRSLTYDQEQAYHKKRAELRQAGISSETYYDGFVGSLVRRPEKTQFEKQAIVSATQNAQVKFDVPRSLSGSKTSFKEEPRDKANSAVADAMWGPTLVGVSVRAWEGNLGWGDGAIVAGTFAGPIIGKMSSIFSKTGSAANTSTKLLTQFTSSTIDDAVSLTMRQKELHIFANKLHPKPWLNQLSTQIGGNQNVIKSALQNANGRILPNAQGVFNTPVNVGGVNFTIRGYINQGTPIINSIFIP